jgi:hypothetical protein
VVDDTLGLDHLVESHRGSEQVDEVYQSVVHSILLGRQAVAGAAAVGGVPVLAPEAAAALEAVRQLFGVSADRHQQCVQQMDDAPNLLLASQYVSFLKQPKLSLRVSRLCLREGVGGLLSDGQVLLMLEANNRVTQQRTRSVDTGQPQRADHSLMT